jgi:hypothetical protein
VVVVVEAAAAALCPKYFNFLIVAKVSREFLGIIWLVTDAFILLTVHGITNLSFICFPLPPYSTAGKTVVYSSLTFVLVEISKSFIIFVKFVIAGLLKLILGLLIGVAVIGDENHQKLAVGYCADILTF